MPRSRRLPSSRAYAIIYKESVKYLMRKKKITIGRSKNLVDIDLQTNSVAISRRHCEITWSSGRLFIKCLGKNGIFINEQHKCPGHVLYRLPIQCRIRFPSTPLELRLYCQPKPQGTRTQRVRTSSILDENEPESPQHLSEVESDLEMDIVPPMTPTKHRRKQILTSITKTKPLIVDKDIDNSVAEKLSSPNNFTNQQTDTILHPGLVESTTTAVLWDVSGETSFQLINTSKPPYSFAQLITQALASQPTRRLTLSGIYQFITQNYPYYRLEDKGWQNSVRHNLSLNKYFCKAPRTPDEPGKGCCWLIDPHFEDRLIDQAFRRRRFHEEHQRRSARQNPLNLQPNTIAYHTIQPATTGQPFTFIPTAQWIPDRPQPAITRKLGFVQNGTQTPTQCNPVLSAQLVLPMDHTRQPAKRIFLLRRPVITPK